MRRPLVTVITPTFNHEQYLGDCIESLLIQSYDNWEQIIIDDGSTDGTERVAHSYTDPRIRYIRREHGGIERLATAYNLALDQARGELVAILEGDDCWPADKLALQVPAFEDPKVVLSWGLGACIDAQGELGEVFRAVDGADPVYRNAPVGTALNRLLFDNFLTPTATVMARTCTLREIGGFLQPRGVPFLDYPTWLALTLKGEFRYVPELVGFWRRHSTQTTTHRYVEVMTGHAACSGQFWQNMPPDLRRQLTVTEEQLVGVNAWYHAMAHLKRRDWRTARQALWTAWTNGPKKVKLKAALAIVGSYLAKDWVAVLQFKPRRLRH